MIRAAAMAGAILFVLLFGLALLVPGWAVKLPLLAVSIAGLLWIARVDKRREARAKKNVDDANDARYRELGRQAERGGFELRVKGWLGRPAIMLNSAGFEAPSVPHVHWSLVDGVTLRTNIVKGTVSYVLSFRIEALPQLIGRCGLRHRLFYPFRRGEARKVLDLALRSTSEHPDVIDAIARLLWRRATGKQYLWHPTFSEETNQALRRSAELWDQLKGVDREQMTRDPAQFERLTAEMRAADDVIRKALRRKQKLAYWTSGGLLVLFLFFLAANLFR